MAALDKKIGFIGCGNMGEAILAGLLRDQALTPAEIIAAEPLPERRQELSEVYKIETVDSNAAAASRARTLLLAVKPFKLNDVKDEIRASLRSEQIVISILAGVSRARLGEALGIEDRSVRVMPNLPALAGAGISAISFPPAMPEADREWVRTVLRSVGAIVEVDESLQDAVTAVSGSGPGYLFYIVQLMIEAAQNEGLAPDVARKLALHTFIGAAEVLKRGGDEPAGLVKKVATPGGTTEAGLSALKEGGLPALLNETVRRAADRSRELNRG
ncbi:MAG: pyrroline-5-carboxylate reductase [bacterium]|nr:pyrroline-5-carboxylate reductase [bacterium]